MSRGKRLAIALARATITALVVIAVFCLFGLGLPPIVRAVQAFALERWGQDASEFAAIAVLGIAIGIPIMTAFLYFTDKD